MAYVSLYSSTLELMPELRSMELPENDQTWKVKDVFVCSTVQRTLHLEFKITFRILNKIQAEQIHPDDRWMAGRLSPLHTDQALKSPSNHGRNENAFNGPHLSIFARGQSLIRSTTSCGNGFPEGRVRRGQSDLGIQVLLLRRGAGAVFVALGSGAVSDVG
jgi:hypothetical protein